MSSAPKKWAHPADTHAPDDSAREDSPEYVDEGDDPHTATESEGGNDEIGDEMDQYEHSRANTSLEVCFTFT